MGLNLKMSLLCAVCVLVSGLLGSFKSYQLFDDHRQAYAVNESHQVSKWVSQGLEMKLRQLESSVSYLDKSTVESLKRLGARYFAYAFKNKDEWSIKWKKLGGLGKEGILAEVGELDFDKLSDENRSWFKTTKDQLLYIAPAGIAESHQLKTGFLVFGVNEDFFKYLSDKDDRFSLYAAQDLNVYGNISSEILTEESLFASQDGEIDHLVRRLQDSDTLVTTYYSAVAQLWVVKAAPMAAISFFGSSFFTYFLLAISISLMAFALLASLIMNNHSAFSRLQIPKSFSLDAFKRRYGAGETSVEPTLSQDLDFEEEQEVADLALWLSEFIAEESERLSKVGVSIKTQFEDGARVRTSPQKLRDFLQRLIGNSVLSLEGETIKEIQLQLAEQSDSFQLIYVDSRSKKFPSGDEASLFLQTEGSLEGIDGIISYASWLFGEALTVAKKGFCLSVDIPKIVPAPASQVVEAVTFSELPAIEEAPQPVNADRIEITDEDTDIDLFGEFSLGQQPSRGEFSGTEELQELEILPEQETEEPKVSFDEVIEQFRMKSFEFDQGPKMDEPIIEEEEISEELPRDDRGLVELDSGQFKLKIRSPRKKDSDVDR